MLDWCDPLQLHPMKWFNMPEITGGHYQG